MSIVFPKMLIWSHIYFIYTYSTNTNLTDPLVCPLRDQQQTTSGLVLPIIISQSTINEMVLVELFTKQKLLSGKDYCYLLLLWEVLDQFKATQKATIDADQCCRRRSMLQCSKLMNNNMI